MHNSIKATTLPVWLRLAVAGLLALGLLVAAPDPSQAATAGKKGTSARALAMRMKVIHSHMERKAVRIAIGQIGDPYRYGAAGPQAFDCSGLTSFSLHRAGFAGVPRTSRAQAGYVHRIGKSKMRVGDLMFFYRGGRVYHVGFFAGWHDGHRILLHAPHAGTDVRRQPVWTTHWFAGTLRTA
jgi:cell wall-associated NlpC family hydrolase